MRVVKVGKLIEFPDGRVHLEGWIFDGEGDPMDLSDGGAGLIALARKALRDAEEKQWKISTRH